jgi:hypothetical protein
MSWAGFDTRAYIAFTQASLETCVFHAQAVAFSLGSREFSSETLIALHWSACKNESATRRQLCDVLSLTLLLRVSSGKASTTHPPIRRAVDNLVKPESNSDASEPDYQQLKALEKSCRWPWFRNFLATI